MDSWCKCDHNKAETFNELDKNLLLNNVQRLLVKRIIKLILIYLSNAFYNFFLKMKNEKQTVFRFPFFIRISSLNLVFLTEVKIKSKYKILNFFLQCTKNTKWHLGTRIEQPVIKQTPKNISCFLSSGFFV